MGRLSTVCTKGDERDWSCLCHEAEEFRGINRSDWAPTLCEAHGQGSKMEPQTRLCDPILMVNLLFSTHTGAEIVLGPRPDERCTLRPNPKWRTWLLNGAGLEQDGPGSYKDRSEVFVRRDEETEEATTEREEERGEERRREEKRGEERRGERNRGQGGVLRSR
ncbi:hypothetical protein BGZ61DRAFT_475017 [Ilyonectria robusta]|uniref:uncharacterized protein n=1 Tax=Ilyonectria robusta TaxID=1079257 RepID=UPI001E8DB604|nr:uncharacterized protein BGZ61DRAFT_475017 [Ilyonectria robusta]KAH8729391.1 hypothetical protein BGZ61DRAFT_475017 [Ilyonectria robusta]